MLQFLINNRKRKMQTRKHPRTLTEAFGPYTDNRIEEAERPMDWQDAVVVVGSIATVAIVLILVFAGWIV